MKRNIKTARHASSQLGKSASNRSASSSTVMITGGARGLGLALARNYAARGFNLALCSRTEEDLLVAKRELEATYPDVKVLIGVCDVGVVDQVKWFVDAAYTAFGDIHILVNNAGIIQVGPYRAMSAADFHDVINANLWGMINTCQAVTPRMIEKGAGKILNIASVGGVFPVPHLLPYTVSKFGAVGFSVALASEMKKHKITVTTAIPGLMRTGSFLNAHFKGQHEKEFSIFTASSVLPLITMSPDRAAAIMIKACERGKSFKVVGIQTKLQRLLFSLLPNFSVTLMGWLNARLPEVAGSETVTAAGPHHAGGALLNDAAIAVKARAATAKKGNQICDKRTPRYVRSRGRKAAAKYNELGTN